MDSLFQNFLRSRGVIPPSSPVDPIATRSYQNISRDVGNVLQQNLPSSFRGAGAQNIPTSILGQVSDIAEMAPGAARERARNQLARNLRMAERGLSPAPTRPAGQGPTGLLRAPSVGNVSPGLNTTLAPRTNIPGSPLATDYALSRQTGMTQALGQARKALSSSPTGALKGAGGLLKGGGNLLGPIGLVADGLSTGKDLKDSLNRGEGFARIPGLVQRLFSGDKKDTTTYSSVPGFIGPVAQPSPGLIGPPVPLVESQRGAWTTKGWDPNAARISPQETPPPAPILPPPESLLPPEERAYQAELARTQQMMASNPYMPQTQLYAQGQSVMQTPEDMAATRDLGLAINRAMYGNQLAPKTPNPLMAGLTPPSGAQPNISIDQERRIGQIDAASEGVQEFMRKYLEGKKKREEED
jgi:hypothetical protein